MFVAVLGSTDIETQRKEKLVSVFQVVKFKNAHCTATPKNGTCFTSAECENIGGTSSGTCADGFGVCCIVTLTSGQSSSQNNTHISLTSTIAAGNHKYTICPCNDNICRIKFDFNTFQLASPNTGMGSVVGYGIAFASAQGVGQCIIDQFQITSPSGRATPQICGFNGNQHMFVDAAGEECLEVNIGIGGVTPTATRSLDITVYQYTCGDEDGGPPGCLQYYQNTVGKIRSFNFPDASPGTAIPGGFAIHLHNQHYKICMRRGLGTEAICYIPCTSTAGVTVATAGVSPTQQPSFGLSPGEMEMEARSVVDTECSTDYIWLRPSTALSTQFSAAINVQDATGVIGAPTRFCGRYLGTTSGGAAYIGTVSICSYGVPFEVGVEFDDSDVCSAATDLQTCESLHEAAAAISGGGGNLGFSLCYIQQTPPFT